MKARQVWLTLRASLWFIPGTRVAEAITGSVIAVAGVTFSLTIAAHARVALVEMPVASPT